MHFDVRSNQEKHMGTILNQTYDKHMVLTKESKDNKKFIIFYN